MYKNIIYLLFSASLLTSAVISADLCTECTHSRPQTTTSLSPVIRFTATPSVITENSGISFLGEIGTRNYRIGGTFGGNLGGMLRGANGDSLVTDQNRVKVSCDYLSQALKYSFSSGQMHRWVNQYSVGGAYQYIFSEPWEACNCLRSLDVNLSYSHAFGRDLKALGCNAPDVLATTVLHRHISEGNNTHLSVGSTLSPWNTGAIFVAADYDFTNYVRNHQHNKKTSGFGATIKLNQNLPYNLALEVLTEFRRPFNYYEGSINWSPDVNFGILKIGTYLSYTHGRDRLPNNTVAGLSIEIAFGGGPLFVYNNTCYVDGNYVADTKVSNCGCSDSELLSWIANPAVYTPTVLAIPDQAFSGIPIPPVTTLR